METKNSSGTKANQSSEKMLVILEYLANQREPVRLLDISKELGVNVSTVLRFVTALVNKGYAAQDEETSRYYLTYKICALANRVSVKIDIRTIAKPYMEELSKIFGESVCLAVEDNEMVVYIEVVEGSGQILRITQRIGNVAPMHCTGIGKLLLMNYSEAELDHLIQVKGLTRFTDHTLTSKWQLKEEIESIRQRGYAYDDEECERGARCVAAPVYDTSGKVIAGISITGPANRLTDTFIKPRIPSLLQMVESISRKMGYKVFES
ncbi:helix-turn-helix domain-containing protein [Anaerocolumna sedimenticola]|uniref:Helix-turn-helix domain-containing protein n=1 Tax=Anaerocolumna sedimenticola TaxID=2696063 RepID=A0A6P1TI83_9FIRM|nr:IclR family transcriptional regulator [Anaerocolumna sedimenticola]QHQ59636.1 helix-turn-helix domain-containing protein [Anaerocolumna sedimenticola]